MTRHWNWSWNLIINIPSQFNRTRGITDYLFPGTAPKTNSHLPYSYRNSTNRYSLTTTMADNLPHHDDEPPTQNHGCHGHTWLDAMVPPCWMSWVGGGWGRFVSVYLETNFRLTYQTIYSMYHAHIISIWHLLIMVAAMAIGDGYSGSYFTDHL